MKFQAIKQNLIEGISNVIRAISNKNTNPIYASIYLRAENDKLILIATDNDIRIETSVPVSVSEAGETVIPGKMFFDLIRELPDITIKFDSFSYEGVDTTTITYGNSKTVIKGFPGRDFPAISPIEEPVNLEIPALLFHKIIKQTSFTVSPDAMREVCRGLLFELNGHELSVVGTDSYRLTLMKEMVNNLGDLETPLEAIIPIRALIEIDRLIKEDDDILKITFTKRQCVLKSAKSKLITQLIKGEYVPYKTIIPSSYQTFFSVDRLELMASLRRATLVANEKDSTSRVMWQVAGGILKVVTESDIAQGDEELVIYQEGENMEITFNSKFLIDAMKNLSSEALEITLTGSTSPCIIRPKDDNNYLYLILPLRR